MTIPSHWLTFDAPISVRVTWRDSLQINWSGEESSRFSYNVNWSIIVWMSSQHGQDIWSHHIQYWATSSSVFLLRGLAVLEVGVVRVSCVLYVRGRKWVNKNNEDFHCVTLHLVPAPLGIWSSWRIWHSENILRLAERKTDLLLTDITIRYYSVEYDVKGKNMHIFDNVGLTW